MSEAFLCSLCLNSSYDYFSLFGEHLRKVELHEKILKYLSIDIKDNVLICTKCIEKIEQFHEFYSEIHQKALLNRVINNSDQNVNKTTTINSDIPTANVANDSLPNYVEIVAKTNIQVTEPSLTSYIVIVDGAKNDVEETTEAANNESHTNLIQMDTIPTTSHYSQPVVPKRKTRKDNLKSIESKSVDVAEEEIIYESENDDDDEENEIVDVVKKPNNYEESYYSQFPKTFIDDGKLIIRGKELTKLIAKFYRLECDLCPCPTSSNSPLNFKKLSTLVTHYKNEHNLKGYVICCGSKFVKIRNMAMHMARHLQPDAFKCPQCQKFLTCPKILQYHIQNHLPEEQRPLKCPEPGCSRRFSYQSALVTHSISHMDETERTSWCCDECGRCFLSSGRLSTHINMAHSKNFEYICHICAKNFTCKSNLSYHLKTHEPHSHQIQCNICFKWLKNKLCLRKHTSSLHSAVRHSCHLCEYSAANKQCLRNHIKVQHSDLKPFECEVCGKTFKLKNTLVNHMVQHTGIKRYSCNFCTRTFASSGNFYAHRKRMHKIALAALLEKKEKENQEFRMKAQKLKSS